jgi:anti-sigma factor RsiW
MIVIDQPHDLSADDEATLVAYVDGNLEPDERGRVEARAASDPSFAAALAQQQQGRDAIFTAAEATGAPLALRATIEGMAAQKGRRHGDRRPSARTRLGGLRWPGAGLVAGAVAAVLAALVLVGGGPGVEDVAAAAVRPPTAAIAPVPADSKLLKERIGDVSFPNYAAKFGWEAVGSRTDEINGRETKTVFYEKQGKRIAYTVVEGDALSKPGDAATAEREGTQLLSLDSEGRTIVTWERNGQTCVLSAITPEVTRDELLTLAAWKGMGGVDF